MDSVSIGEIIVYAFGCVGFGFGCLFFWDVFDL